MNIRPLIASDYPQVAAIYKDGIETGLATFETEVPNWEKWNVKFMQSSRLIAEEDQIILGWAALSPVSDRCVYEGVAENTIYVSKESRGKGIGKILLNRLVSESEIEGFWTLQAGIFSENIASIELHKSCGFRVIGIRERVAQRNGIWYDNTLMERRSNLF